MKRPVRVEEGGFVLDEDDLAKLSEIVSNVIMM
jgi:hypothetical protein